MSNKTNIDNGLLLNEKTKSILERIDNYKKSNPNIFLLNLWKNFIINKMNDYTKTLEECEIFLDTLTHQENVNSSINSVNSVNSNIRIQDISHETILLLYSLLTNMN